MISPDAERSGSRCSSKVRLLRLYSNCDDAPRRRFVMLHNRRGVRILAFQIFVDGFAEQLLVANFCPAQSRAEARRDAEILVGRPDDHRHLIDQQFQMRFVGGLDRVRCDARAVFDDRDDVTVVVANRCVRQPNENLRAVFVRGAAKFRGAENCQRSPRESIPQTPDACTTTAASARAAGRRFRIRRSRRGVARRDSTFAPCRRARS